MSSAAMPGNGASPIGKVLASWLPGPAFFERFMSGYQQVVGPMIERFGSRCVLMDAGTGRFRIAPADADGIVAAGQPNAPRAQGAGRNSHSSAGTSSRVRPRSTSAMVANCAVLDDATAPAASAQP